MPAGAGQHSSHFPDSTVLWARPAPLVPLQLLAAANWQSGEMCFMTQLLSINRYKVIILDPMGGHCGIGKKQVKEEQFLALSSG